MTVKLMIVLCFSLCAMPALASEAAGGHEFDKGVFFAQVLNVGIFTWILYFFLRDPIRNFFVSRRAHIRESLELAERSREEARVRLEEIEKKMASLEGELAGIEEQARQDAEREKQRIHEAAQSEAERTLAQAKAEVENMQRQAMLELRRYAADLAINGAIARIESDLTDKQRKAVFDEFVEHLEVQP